MVMDMSIGEVVVGVDDRIGREYTLHGVEEGALGFAVDGSILPYVEMIFQ